MAEIKWIKICTDIFDDEKILLIESMPKADTIIVVWFKLLCLAGKQNNNGVFTLNGKIAYTDKMLANLFRRPLSVVKKALEVFEEYGMIEVVDETITIPKWDKHQNIEKLEKAKEDTRQRVAKYREKQKSIVTNSECNNECNALHSVTDTVTKHQCNATDKEEDKDIDRECKHSLNASAKCNADCNVTFERFWEAYPKKRGKAEAKKEWENSNAAEHIEDILKALSWQTKLTQWIEDNGRYIPSPANYIKDGRWEDIPPVPKIENKSYDTEKVGKNSVTDWIKKYAEGEDSNVS